MCAAILHRGRVCRGAEGAVSWHWDKMFRYSAVADKALDWIELRLFRPMGGNWPAELKRVDVLLCRTFQSAAGWITGVGRARRGVGGAGL